MDTPSVFKLSSNSCNACNVSFEDDDARRAHSKSQWHVENLRRRVAGLPPIDASAVAAASSSLEKEKKKQPDEQRSDSDYSTSSDKEDIPREPALFVVGQCLFCSKISETIYDSLSHMQESHGLFIPSIDNLVVDVETLVRYLWLVISDYRECLYCHTQRRTVQAVQQHMISGNGHAKFDIEQPDSEFRDFYDFSAEQEEGTQHNNDVPQQQRLLTLPSGKTVTHRTATATEGGQGRNRTAPSSSSSNTLPPAQDPTTTSHDAERGSSSSQVVVKRQEKLVGSLTNQLASLSVNDRASLAHLPVSEQRAVLATQKKQVEKARQAEQRYRNRVEMLGNKTLMKTFVNDVPGRSNG
ncbi:C2H2 type zinc-finger-domain-containing protein [Apodospora peruviana]|uniref:C2H2 type zinc-finger-domain-containing protein n=1 Tax=Apodospora peruviana TaxID=516989 RepID=A0AAE0M048_9PEZI|nr:C2H2 type zinc-finger-domain-containing protein [Apodospora peruviana]